MPPNALDNGQRSSRKTWFLRMGIVLALVAPIVLALTLPYSESAVGGVTVLGVSGGISSAICAGTLYSRNLKETGIMMTGAQVGLWVLLGIALALFLGFVTFSIWFARGPDTFYPG
jgi:hypothetical protein